MQIRLLGGIEAVAADGRAIDVGPAKCRVVLAALALSPGSAVPVSRLVTLVWGDDPPRTAAKTLQTYVGRLRRALGPERLVRVDDAYRLDVDPPAVDAVRFQLALAEGDTATALAQWAGTPLAGLRADGLQPAIDGLIEQWLGAVEADLAARLDIDPGSVVSPLTGATREHPFREGLWALLMTALYRTGRQADALAAYAEVRTLLIEELGVEPGPRLRELEGLILDHDEGLAAPVPRQARPEPPPGPRAGGPGGPPVDAAIVGNLPAIGDDDLIGRAGELRRIGEALSGGPLVTLVGPGGIGKTRLALAAANLYRPPGTEEVWFVALAGVPDPGEVEREVTGLLELRDGRTLRGRRLLVVLDNCEHVIEAAAAVVRGLLEGGEGIRLLVTSREGLGLSGERVLPIPALEPDGAAVELFCRRAEAAGGICDPVADRSTVVEICRRLDGLPLAIELAAARTRTLRPAQVLDRLDDRFRLLTGGRRSDDDRHRTLRSTIAWSHDLLEPDERILFRRLSVFSGSFDLAGAEAVGRAADDPPGPEVDDGLHRLVARSMVDVVSSDGGPRFRLLETIGQFGREELRRSGEESDVAGRHGQWVLSEVRAVGRGLAGWGELEAAARLADLWPDLRTAVNEACRRNDHGLVRDLIDPVATEVYVRNRSEIGLWAERLLAITPDEETATRTFAVTWAARRYMRLQDRFGFRRLLGHHPGLDDPMIDYARGFLDDDPGLCIEAAPRAEAQLRRRGEHYKADLFAVVALGPTLMSSGRLADHDRLMLGLIEHFRHAGPPTCLSWALMMMALSSRTQHRFDEAEGFLRQSAEVELPARTSSLSKGIEARALYDQGRHRRAFGLFGTHLAELVEVGDLFGAKVGLIDVIHMLIDSGHPVEAAVVLGWFERAGGIQTGGGWPLSLRSVDRLRDVGDPLVADGWERGRSLDDRAVLAEVVATLTRLADEPG